MWKKIRGFNYYINKKGEVLSGFTNKKLKPCLGYGYLRVTLTKNGKQYGFFLHTLIAKAFIPNPKRLPIINHKDENKKNNKISNLEWCTYQYNNTYNDLHKRKGKKLRGRIPWNKGKTGVMSEEGRHSISISRKKRGFTGNQYTK